MQQHKRANVTKLIHCWIPANKFLIQQDSAISPMFLRCLDQHESADHFLTCPQNEAKESWHSHLYKMLLELEKVSTSLYVQSILVFHLSQTLDVASKELCDISDQLEGTIITTIKQSNIKTLLDAQNF